MLHQIKKSAFSLIEVILAVALFSVFAAVMLTAVAGVGFSIENSEDRLVARYLTQEANEAMRSIKEYDFAELASANQSPSTNGLGKHASDYWEFSGTSDTYGKFTRTVELTELSSIRYQADITITWTTDEGVAQTKSSTTRLTNWKQLSFTLTSQSEFDNGFYNSIKSLVAGSLDLRTVDSWETGSFTELNVDADGGTGDAYEMLVDNNLLYLATENNASGHEFYIYDISDVSDGAISEIGSVEIGATVYDFVISANYAYLATDTHSDLELTVIDLSDLSKDEYALPSTNASYGIAAQGNNLLITRAADATTEEVMCVDISTPSSLNIGAAVSLETGVNIYDVAADSTYMYLVGAGAEFGVYNLCSSTFVNSNNLTGAADAITLELDSTNNVAYLGRATSGQNEFVGIDISDPATSVPTIDSFNTGGNLNDIYVSDDRAYLAASTDSAEMGIIDVSTSSYSLVSTSNITGAGDGEAVWFQGSHIFLGSDTDNSELFALTSGSGGGGEWTLPSLTSENPPQVQNMYDVVNDGTYAYFGRDSNGTCDESTGAACEFLVYRMSDLTLVAAKEIGVDVNDIYLNGSHAYLATDGVELQAIDISDPTNPGTPFDVHNSEGGSNGEAVWGSGNYIFLGTQNNSGDCTISVLQKRNCEVWVLDIAVPISPVFLGGVEVGNGVHDITGNGNYIYVANGGGGEEINIVDTTPFSTPITEVTPTTYNIADGTGATFGLHYDTSDDTLHIARASTPSANDYVILDASSAPTLTLASGLDTGSTNNMVTLIGDYAFLASDGDNEEFKVIDITDTSAPTLITEFDLDGDANGITTDGTHLYIANEHSTQEVQKITEGSTPSTATTSKFGIYTTEKFDSASTSTDWVDLEWTASSTSGTEIIKFQSRTASSLVGLNSATWVGTGGSSSAYYTSSPATIAISGDSTGTRYLQIAAYFEGDGSETPLLDDLQIIYFQ